MAAFAARQSKCQTFLPEDLAVSAASPILPAPHTPSPSMFFFRKSGQSIGNPYQMEDNKNTKGAARSAAPLERRRRRRIVVFHLVRISYVLAWFSSRSIDHGTGNGNKPPAEGGVATIYIYNSPNNACIGGVLTGCEVFFLETGSIVTKLGLNSCMCTEASQSANMHALGKRSRPRVQNAPW